MSKQNETNDFWEWVEENKENIPTEVYLQLADLALQKCRNTRIVPENEMISDEIKTLENRTFIRGHTNAINSVAVKNNKIVSGSWDKTIKIWDLNSGECLKTLRGHECCVLSIAIKNDKIVSGSDDKTIKIWDLSTDN